MTAEQLQFPTAREVCELVFGDPVHERDRAAVVEAIRADAAAHDGEVDSNRVREALPTWVYPRSIGAVYNALRARGLLVANGYVTNTDTRGRNAGRPARLYRWTGEL